MIHSLLMSTFASAVLAGSTVTSAVMLAQDPLTIGYDAFMKGGVVAALAGILLWQTFAREKEIRQSADATITHLRGQLVVAQERLDAVHTDFYEKQRQVVAEHTKTAQDVIGSVSKLTGELERWRETRPCLFCTQPSEVAKFLATHQLSGPGQTDAAS